MSFLRDPQRLIATLIAGVVGLLVLLDYADVFPPVDLAARTLINWAALLAGMGLVVGLLSVTMSHVVRVFRRQSDWGYSLLLLLSMLITIVSGTVIGFVANPNGGFDYVIPTSLREQPIRNLFEIIYQPLAASFLALLAFFSLSAALRALRRRTLDAIVIIGVALCVLVVAAFPQAEAVPVLGAGVEWVNSYVVLAGARGLLLGASIGALVAGVRVLLGFDQPYLDR
jgi:hypothetical protein